MLTVSMFVWFGRTETKGCLRYDNKSIEGFDVVVPLTLRHTDYIYHKLLCEIFLLTSFHSNCNKLRESLRLYIFDVENGGFLDKTWV